MLLMNSFGNISHFKNIWSVYLLQIGLLGPDQLGDSGTQLPFLQTKVSGPFKVLVLLQL